MILIITSPHFIYQSPLLLNGPPACLSSILLKNIDLRYSLQNYNEYSLQNSDDTELSLSPGRLRSDIKEILVVNELAP